MAALSVQEPLASGCLPAYTGAGALRKAKRAARAGSACVDATLAALLFESGTVSH